MVSTFKDTMVWYYLYIRGKLKALTKVVLLVTLVYFSLLFCVGASVKSDQLLGFYLFILVGFIKKRNNVKPITNFTTIFLKQTCHSITLAIKKLNSHINFFSSLFVALRGEKNSNSHTVPLSILTFDELELEME